MTDVLLPSGGEFVAPPTDPATWVFSAPEDITSAPLVTPTGWTEQICLKCEVTNMALKEVLVTLT